MKWKLGLYSGLQGLGFPKIRGTFLGVPIIRTIVCLGLYWGPVILGNYHIANKPVLYAEDHTAKRWHDP